MKHRKAPECQYCEKPIRPAEGANVRFKDLILQSFVTFTVCHACLPQARLNVRRYRAEFLRHRARDRREARYAKAA